MKNQLNILSIDGGGIRGIIPALVLAEIEKIAGKPCCELFDLIAGTSTGGILALGLNIPEEGTHRPRFSAAELADLYIQHGKSIFKESGWRKKLGIMDDLFDETYNHEGIESLLKKYFGDTMLSQSLSQVLVTAYDIQAREMFLFNSRLAKNPDPAKAAPEEHRMRDIARATSAAPTFFEPKQLQFGTQGRVLVDGGVIANNPSLLAYTEAKQLIDRNKKQESQVIIDRDSSSTDVDAREIEEPIFLLSLGTGDAQKPYTYDQAKGWGYIGWIRPLIEILMQGNSDSVHYQVERLLPPRPKDGSARYMRFNILDMAAKHTDMDDTSPANIKALEKYAEKLIESSKRRLNAVIGELEKS